MISAVSPFFFFFWVQQKITAPLHPFAAFQWFSCNLEISVPYCRFFFYYFNSFCINMTFLILSHFIQIMSLTTAENITFFFFLSPILILKQKLLLFFKILDECVYIIWTCLLLLELEVSRKKNVCDLKKMCNRNWYSFYIKLLYKYIKDEV